MKSDMRRLSAVSRDHMKAYLRDVVLKKARVALYLLATFITLLPDFSWTWSRWVDVPSRMYNEATFTLRIKKIRSVFYLLAEL